MGYWSDAVMAVFKSTENRKTNHYERHEDHEESIGGNL